MPSVDPYLSLSLYVYRHRRVVLLSDDVHWHRCEPVMFGHGIRIQLFQVRSFSRQFARKL